MDPVLLLAGALALLLVWAIADDCKRRIIPNQLTAIVALGAIGWWWANDLHQADILIRIGLALLAFAVFAGLFALGAMGGGDVKLIAAVALWLAPGQLERMLVWMALLGGVLTLGLVGWTRLRRGERPEIPYGVAISVATLMVMGNDLLTTGWV